MILGRVPVWRRLGSAHYGVPGRAHDFCRNRRPGADRRPVFLSGTVRVRTASTVQSCSLWIVVTAGSAIFGGIVSPILSGYSIVVVVAGLLSGKRAGIAICTCQHRRSDLHPDCRRAPRASVAPRRGYTGLSLGIRSRHSWHRRRIDLLFHRQSQQRPGASAGQRARPGLWQSRIESVTNVAGTTRRRSRTDGSGSCMTRSNSTMISCKRSLRVSSAKTWRGASPSGIGGSARIWASHSPRSWARTDFDLNPRGLAEQYHLDDLSVCSSGERVDTIVEHRAVERPLALPPGDQDADI